MASKSPSKGSPPKKATFACLGNHVSSNSNGYEIAFPFLFAASKQCVQDKYFHILYTMARRMTTRMT